jgi:hypothetical protein
MKPEGFEKPERSAKPEGYEYQSDFARLYHAEGLAEGRALGIELGRVEGLAEGEQRGRATLVLRLLSKRFGHLTSKTERRLLTASISELEAIAERALVVSNLQDALGWKRRWTA